MQPIMPWNAEYTKKKMEEKQLWKLNLYILPTLKWKIFNLYSGYTLEYHFLFFANSSYTFSDDCQGFH